MEKFCMHCKQFKVRESFLKKDTHAKCNECRQKINLSLIKFNLEKIDNVKNLSKTIWCSSLRVSH